MTNWHRPGGGDATRTSKLTGAFLRAFGDGVTRELVHMVCPQDRYPQFSDKERKERATAEIEATIDLLKDAEDPSKPDSSAQGYLRTVLRLTNEADELKTAGTLFSYAGETYYRVGVKTARKYRARMAHRLAVAMTQRLPHLR
jgi:hypothetical protein